MGRHLISLTSMSRGNEVRQAKLVDLAVQEYPTTTTPEQDAFAGRVGTHTMSCFTFTNTNGKSNPGDRVDMDVSAVSI